MDPQFLTFWGNFLLQAAEGQKRFEDLTRWMKSGLSGSRDLSEMFMEAYGLKRDPKSGFIRSDAREKAAAQFQKALSEYLDLFGAVPRSRYETLRKEAAKLEAKVDEQAKTIQRLRLELAESRAAEGKTLDSFQQLMEVQNEQFRKVSENLGRFFAGGSGKGEQEGAKSEDDVQQPEAGSSKPEGTANDL